MQDNKFSDVAINNFKASISAQNDEIMRLKQLIGTVPSPASGITARALMLLVSADECLNLALQYGRHLSPIKEDVCLIVDEIWDLRKEEIGQGQWSTKRIERLKSQYWHKYVVLRTINKAMAPLIQQAASYLDLYSLEAEIGDAVSLKGKNWTPALPDVTKLLEALSARTKEFHYEISLLATCVPEATPLSATASAARVITSPESEALVEIYWFCQSRIMSQLAFAADYARVTLEIESTRSHTVQTLTLASARGLAAVHLAQAALNILREAVAALASADRIAELSAALEAVHKVLAQMQVLSTRLRGREAQLA